MGDKEIWIWPLEDPKVSLSQDHDKPEVAAIAEKLKRDLLAMEEEEAAEAKNHEEGGNDDNFTEFSFEFSSSMSLDLPFEDKMLSAEELFFNGKLRPLLDGLSDTLGQETKDLHYEGKVQVPNTFVDNCDAVPRRNSDVKREASYYSGADVDFRANLPLVRTSLHESLALAKHHLRSLHESPRCLSMTIEGSRGHPRRSCVSLNSSRCSSPTRSRTSGTFSLPPTTPTSPKASSSTQKSSKFLHLFKLKKHLSSNKEALLLSSDNPKAIGSRLSRTFWPFSRSNSAGESKSSHGVSPLPRRSNSAGESKTTSTSLLPNAINNKRNSEAARSGNTIESLVASSRRHHAILSLTQQVDKKGLPPLSMTSNFQKNGACFVDGATHTCAEVIHTASAIIDEPNHLAHRKPGSSSILKEFAANSASSGGHVRHASASHPARKTTRGSPARQWSNPNLGSSTRSMQRFGAPPTRVLNVRPKDALSRETASVRVTPVLNVPACMTPSKSKLFNLSNLFSKKEKGARGYTMLVAANSQSGG